MRFWHVCSLLAGASAALAVLYVERGEYVTAVLWACAALLWAQNAHEGAD